MWSSCYHVSWVITLGNGAELEIQCWSLLLANWSLSHEHRQFTLGEWKSMLLSSYITFIPATMATLFMSSLKYDKDKWGKRLACILIMSNSIYLIIKIFLLKSPFGDHSCGIKYVHIYCPYGEVYLHTSSLNFLATNFPNHVLSKTLTIRQNH